METQSIPDKILMIRPAAFGFNTETADTNKFQQPTAQAPAQAIADLAIQEFDNMVDILRKHDVDVLVLEDSPQPVKPDAVFPDWLSFHANGHVILYPLAAPSRRICRNKDILTQVEAQFEVKQYHHFEQYEANKRFLEGTGSIVFDREHKVAYACSSPRTDATLLAKLCKEIEYQPVSFRAVDEQEQEIYHTNMMMMVGDTYAVVCMDSVLDGADRLLLTQILRTTKKDIIEISLAQVAAFAGNMLQVRSKSGEKYVIMSESAKKVLNPRQLERLESHNPILSIPIPTIQMYGGGSVRSMMAEIYLNPLDL